jgi:predicted metal-dependent hydrolase
MNMQTLQSIPSTSVASAPPKVHKLARRRVDFAFDPTAVPLDWCYNDTFTTTFANALSLLFPEGEKFFVDSVKRHRDRVTEPERIDEINAFIGQEAMHGKAHRHFNDFIEGQGYGSLPSIDAHIRGLLNCVKKVRPREQLAITAALEHFTAILAETLLREEDFILDKMHPAIRNLWAWHALEESEHKAVAFDLYEEIGGTYLGRVLAMILATAIFCAEVTHLHGRLLHDRRLLLKPWKWRKGITYLWVNPGHMRKLWPQYLAYFKPGFHPNDRNTDALMHEWRQRLFGADGELEDELASDIASANYESSLVE